MSRKNLDRKGRLRSVTVGFRMSPEEAELLNFLVGLSGLTKQDYIIRKLADREVTVVPSSRVQRFLLEEMRRVYRELRRIGRASEMDGWLRERVTLLEERFITLDRDTSVKGTAQGRIRRMKRLER